MGSDLGPNYACLFVGNVEERMLSSYTGMKLDNVAGATSCSEGDLRQFLEFASSNRVPPRLAPSGSFLSIFLSTSLP